MCRGAVIAAAVTAAALAVAPPQAAASRSIQYGVQDEAWLVFGTRAMPLLEDRLQLLDRLGVDVVRYTVGWNRIAASQPADPANPDDPAYDWRQEDALLRGLHRHGIKVLLTLWGTPAWANGGHRPSRPPRSRLALAAFASAVAKRYPWVRLWEVWNEPNQRGGLNPNSPRLYVKRLLNPTVTALHALNPANLVAAGATSPRATRTARSAVRFMRGMRAAGARFDVYSHHPYPRAFGRGRLESPLVRLPCGAVLTMGNLQCLLAEVRRDFGPKRVWLTEYAYKTNPPDRWRGVSPALQARYLGEAALRTYRASRVDMLIQFLIRDEATLGRWSSGLFTASERVKPAFYAFMLPLAEVSRRGRRTVLWGQVRPWSGPQPYLLQRLVSGEWVAAGELGMTDENGYLTEVVHARRGARLRLCSLVEATCSPALAIR